jgi:predicted AAA+ superfamily ATPase
MEKELIDELIKLVVSQSPWHADEANWHKQDGALLEVNSAESLGFYHPPKKYYFLKERFFDPLATNNQLFGVIVIRGPRRVGKTSTLKYAVRELIKAGFPAKSIFYMSLDVEELCGVLEKKKLLKEFLSEIIKRYSLVKPLIIILDEVTFYPGWGRAIKNLIDEGAIGKGVAVIATGSYALDLTSARSELAGRYGPLGERCGGEVFFPPRRFAEVAESILPQSFLSFLGRRLGRGVKKVGLLEFFSGWQTEEEAKKWVYFTTIDEFMSKHYKDVHGILEIYKQSGGYPRTVFEAILSQRSADLKITDARYIDDIYRLLISDCRKFKLDENELQKMLLSVDKPAMRIAASYTTLSSLKKDEIERYIDYLVTSGLISFIPNISSPDEIKSDMIICKGDKLKLVVNDPSVFIALYCGSRNIASIFNKVSSILTDCKGETLESMAISHLKFFSVNQPFNNIAYILHEENKQEIEVCDAFLWYLNFKNQLVTIPIEVKCYDSINLTEIREKADLLIEKYGAKRLIVVSNKNIVDIQKKYVIIPIELFLLLF